MSSKLHNEWTKNLKELNNLYELSVPRFLYTEDDDHIDVHGFADASLAAYGAYIYIRVTNKSGNYTSHLLCVKSKVTPLKVISLSCLELCTAIILARLFVKVEPTLDLKIQKRFFWFDSSIVQA